MVIVVYQPAYHNLKLFNNLSAVHFACNVESKRFFGGHQICRIVPKYVYPLRSRSRGARNFLPSFPSASSKVSLPKDLKAHWAQVVQRLKRTRLYLSTPLASNHSGPSFLKEVLTRLPNLMSASSGSLDVHRLYAEVRVAADHQKAENHSGS